MQAEWLCRVNWQHKVFWLGGNVDVTMFGSCRFPSSVVATAKVGRGAASSLDTGDTHNNNEPIGEVVAAGPSSQLLLVPHTVDADLENHDVDTCQVVKCSKCSSYKFWCANQVKLEKTGRSSVKDMPQVYNWIAWRQGGMGCLICFNGNVRRARSTVLF